MMSLPPQMLQQMLAANAARGNQAMQPMGGKFPVLQPFQPGSQPPQMGAPQQPFGQPMQPPGMQPMPYQGFPPVDQPMGQPYQPTQPMSPAMNPGMPAQPGTFSPLPFEGGLGGLPKAGMRKGLGAGFGIGHFGVQPLTPGMTTMRGQQY